MKNYIYCEIQIKESVRWGIKVILSKKKKNSIAEIDYFVQIFSDDNHFSDLIVGRKTNKLKNVFDE